MRLTLFKRVLSELDSQIRMIVEAFEVTKQHFRSQYLRDLCTLRKVTLADELSEEWSALEQPSGKVDNYLPLLEPFTKQIFWSQT